ncbi:MAG: arylsulfotransferase family protein, partial [Acidobacteriota bacterium]
MSKSFLWVLSSVAILAVGLWIWVFVSGREGSDLVDAEDIRPAGRWHYQPDPGLGDPSAQELARVLSLPYVDGKVIAPASSGVTIYDSDRIAPGVNMYVSFPTKELLPGTEYFRRAQVLPNGELLAIYQGAGMVKMDVASNLLWVSDLSFYNDFFVADDGKIWSIAKRAVTRADIRPDSKTLEDSIVVLDAEGNLIETISLLDAFLASDYADLIHPLPEVADIFHTNTIQVMDGSLSSLSPLFSQGLLLISLRQIDIVAFVDPSSATPLRAWRGPWVMQHEPTVLPDGRLLVFDN